MTAPTALRIDQQVYLGAFKLDLKSATVTADAKSAKRGVVTVDFEAENLTESVHTPLSGLDRDAVLLEIGGKFVFGGWTASEVPGLRKGPGSLSFVTEDLAATTAQLATAVLSLGWASSNQVVVPFANPASSTRLSDQELTTRFTTETFRYCTFELTAARVTYNYRSGDRPLAKNAAQLVLSLLIAAEPTAPGWNWGTGTITVKRPDGVVSAPFLNELIGEGYRKTLSIPFDIASPVAGTYTFTLTWGDMIITRPIVVL